VQPARIRAGQGTSGGREKHILNARLSLELSIRGDVNWKENMMDPADMWVYDGSKWGSPGCGSVDGSGRSFGSGGCVNTATRLGDEPGLGLQEDRAAYRDLPRSPGPIGACHFDTKSSHGTSGIVVAPWCDRGT
jgi:hypothetical protein